MDVAIKLFLDSIQYLWPIKIVPQNAEGGYFIFGRWYFLLKPGGYPVIPFFCEVKTAVTAEAIVGTGRQDITVADGTMVSYAATAKIRVIDVKKALLAVDEYKETMQELLSSIIAERLVAVKPERLTPANRAGLLRDLRKWVEEEALEYGISVSKVRFNSFLSKVRAHRLLIDQSSVQSW